MDYGKRCNSRCVQQRKTAKPYYLETSFFSACVTTRADVDSQSWRKRSLAWLKGQATHHELFISDEVLGELAAPSYPNSREALRFTAGITVLEVSDEVLGLGQVLIDEKVMPGPNTGDAVHVAAAIYYRLEYMLTWNVKHLANLNKRTHLAKVCLKVGRVPPMIVTPDVLWEDANE